MASSAPWFEPHLYASFQQWSSRESTCIAPTLKDNNRRCYVGIDNARALYYKQIAEALPLGAERNSALRNLILTLCCDFAHRRKIEINRNDVLTKLAATYGQHLRSQSTVTIKFEDVHPQVLYEIKPVIATKLPKNVVQSLIPFKPRVVDTNSVRDEIVQDVDVKYQPVGQVYCATCPDLPGFVKIGYTASSAADRVANQDQCFPGINLEAAFHFAFPEKIERLLHRQLLECRHEIIACESCDRGHIEWFKMPAFEAVEILSGWYKLTQKEPLYGLDRKLNSPWTLRISKIPGDLSASVLLDTLSGSSGAVLNNDATMTSIAESSTALAITELLAEIRILREELKSAKVTRSSNENFEQSSNPGTEHGPTISPPKAVRDVSEAPNSEMKAAELPVDKVAVKNDNGETSLAPAQQEVQVSHDKTSPASHLSSTKFTFGDSTTFGKDVNTKLNPIFTPVKQQPTRHLLPLTPPTTVKKPVIDMPSLRTPSFSNARPSTPKTLLSTDSSTPPPPPSLSPMIRSHLMNLDTNDGSSSSRSPIFSHGSQTSSKATGLIFTNESPFSSSQTSSSKQVDKSEQVKESFTLVDKVGSNRRSKPAELDSTSEASTKAAQPFKFNIPDLALYQDKGTSGWSVGSDDRKVFISEPSSRSTESIDKAKRSVLYYGSLREIPPVRSKKIAIPSKSAFSLPQSTTSVTSRPITNIFHFGLGESAERKANDTLASMKDAVPKFVAATTKTMRDASSQTETDSTTARTAVDEDEDEDENSGRKTETGTGHSTSTAITDGSVEAIQSSRLLPDVPVPEVDHMLTFFSDFMTLLAQGGDMLNLSKLAQQVVPAVTVA